MKWYWRVMVFLAVATLLFVIGGMAYVVRAKYQMNEYVLQLGAAFNAATIVNAEETHTDEQRAVIAQYEERRAVLSPDNYRALLSYLRRDYAMPLFARVDREKALHISICGESHLYVQGDQDGQGALLLFESRGERYYMHVTGGDLWEKIVDISLDGRHQYPNIPL